MYLYLFCIMTKFFAIVLLLVCDILCINMEHYKIRRPLLQVTQDSIFMRCVRRQPFLITNIPYDFEIFEKHFVMTNINRNLII